MKKENKQKIAEKLEKLAGLIAEKKKKKPVKLADNKVKFNNNTYQSYDSPEQYNQALAQSRVNPDLPIPVLKNSPSYRRIFGDK
jgi:hypothetical protein